MKNIEIVIDASASAIMHATEKYLINLQFDPSLENDNINVSYYSSGEKLRAKLHEIDLSSDEKRKFFMSGDNYSEIIKSKFESNPDMVIFISDCMENPLSKNSITNDKTILLVVSTQELRDAENYIKQVKDLPNIKTTTSSKYLSPYSLMSAYNNFRDKLDKLRGLSNNENLENKLKP